MSYTPYEEHNHKSPFHEGKRNSSFVHPNLRSSNIFYDYDYSYKNDLPNPRLLTSVKNDKFSTPSRDERIQTRSTYEAASDEKAERRGTAFYSSQRPSVTEPNDEDRYQRNIQSARGKANDGPEKFCHGCVNSTLAEKQKCRKDNEKARDTEHMKEWVTAEKKKAAYNYDKERQERVIGKKEKQESKNHAALYEYQRIYGKEEPVIEGGVVIDALFDKHDERERQNSAIEKNLRGYNFEKMVDTQVKKEVDRLDRLTSPHNSLQVEGIYVNKYLPPSSSVVRELEQQMESNADRKAREKQAEQRLDQEILEANFKALEKEKQAKREKVESYQRMLSDQLNARTQEKELNKEKEKVEKHKAKYYAEQCVEDHNTKQLNKELTNKKNKEMFMNSLKEHQIESSYRKKFEQKKQHLEGNGFSLKLGNNAELHPCSGCNKLNDKVQLSHFKH